VHLAAGNGTRRPDCYNIDSTRKSWWYLNKGTKRREQSALTRSDMQLPVFVGYCHVRHIQFKFMVRMAVLVMLAEIVLVRILWPLLLSVLCCDKAQNNQSAIRTRTITDL
jgi:hypothetical protein